VIVYDARVAKFVEERLGTVFVPPYVAIGVEKNSRIVAGCVLNVYTGPDIEATVAALRGGITRAFIRACGRYVFHQLGCERVTFTTENPYVVDFAKRLGAQIEGMKRHAFGRDRHASILGIIKTDWKFLDSPDFPELHVRHGREVNAEAQGN